MVDENTKNPTPVGMSGADVSEWAENAYSSNMLETRNDVELFKDALNAHVTAIYDYENDETIYFWDGVACENMTITENAIREVVSNQPVQGRTVRRVNVKQKGILKDRFKTESWDKIAFWADGTWAEVGSGYGGEQSGNNPIFMLSRSSFYDTTQAERIAMIKALDEAVRNEGQLDFWREYEGFMGVQ